LISSAVFDTSSEKRIICRDATDSGFILLITCEGSSESARQAEPDEAQMPSLSSRMSSASDSKQWKKTLAVLACR
jgi:hypothetical protein